MRHQRGANWGGRQRGLALALVIIHATLIMAAWAAANRTTVDLVRLKEYMDGREESQGYREAAARQLAMAYGLALLRTGAPPLPNGETSYTCSVSVDADPSSVSDAPHEFTLTFEPVGDPIDLKWKITLDKVGAIGSDRPWNFAP